MLLLLLPYVLAEIGRGDAGHLTHGNDEKRFVQVRAFCFDEERVGRVGESKVQREIAGLCERDGCLYAPRKCKDHTQTK